MSRNSNDYYLRGRFWGNDYRQRSFFELPSNNYSPYPIAPFSQHPFAGSPYPMPAVFQHPFAGFPFSREIFLPFQAKDKTVVEISTDNDSESDGESTENNDDDDDDDDSEDCDDHQDRNDQQQINSSDDNHTKAVKIFKCLTVDEQEQEIGILSVLLGGVRINRFQGESDNDYRVRSFSELYRYLPRASEYPESFFDTYKRVEKALLPPLPPGQHYLEPYAIKRSTFELVQNRVGVSSSNSGNGNGKKPRFSLKFWKWF